MKQGTVKTLGVAVLGAAMAATAGTAQAVGGVDKIVGDTVKDLPLQETGELLPAGGPQALAAGQKALEAGTGQLPGTSDGALSHSMPADANAQGSTGDAGAVGGEEASSDPAKDLLGGLPVKLPAGDLLAGLPVGL